MADSAKLSPPDFLTIGEAAEFRGVSTWTLHNWDSSGKFKAVRDPLNGYRIYRRDELESALHSFALYCAYPLQSFDDVRDENSFKQICNCHTPVSSRPKAIRR